MKCSTLICLLVIGQGWARPESLSANVTDQDNVQGRILYTGSQLWKTYDVTKDQIKVLAELRDENGMFKN